MRLKNIIEGLNIVSMKNFKNYNIKSITHISKDVTGGGMFVCIKGGNFDGNDYIDEALRLGAKCIVTENEIGAVENVCVIVVKDVRVAMSGLAKNFYNKCCDCMKIIGVVGTSGKTTTALILSQILNVFDKNVGVIGTNGVYIGNIRQDNKFTTPDPLELHYIFYQMKMLGVKIVVMEVSAQAIYYNKLYGVMFDICVFTNISREHLDFFGSFEKYVKVKMNFFNKNQIKECVINVDDFYGRELAYKVDIPCVSYGITEPANTFAIDIKYGLYETMFVANVLDSVAEVSMPFVGKYNVYNMLASLTVAKMLGLSDDKLKKSIADLKSIDGRYNVYNINGKEIVIDFAHTPDSIDKLLNHIKEHSSKKIVSVFGCVGYSDKEKRLAMARVVASCSGRVVVTTDNRGSVVFETIAKDIIEGLNNVEYVCIEDRCEAIKYAYRNMSTDDILVLIGKGAENFQMIGTERVPYSDKECVMMLEKED